MPGPVAPLGRLRNEGAVTEIFRLDDIQRALETIDVVAGIEAGFVAYSRGEVVVPPVGELLFEEPHGEAHIKYGYIENDDYFVIKVASGFYDNYKLGLPTNFGLMLLFSQKTGELVAILLDDGVLTGERTAAAGAVAAKYLAPESVERIGVLGTGDQARRQLRYLTGVVDCRDVLIQGRSSERADACKRDVKPLGYTVETTLDAAEVGATCNLIVTVTPSREPLLNSADIRPGTHITAVGSDTPDKQELDPRILAAADIIVADSIAQCHTRGEIYQAMAAGLLDEDDVVELGNVIAHEELRRATDEQITVADLTGVAVQDVQIAKAVYAALS